MNLLYFVNYNNIIEKTKDNFLNPESIKYLFNREIRLAGQRVRIWSARPAGTAPLQDPPGTILRADADGILVNCGRGQLLVQRLQLPGGRPLAVRELLNGAGHLLAPGARFESPA